MTQTYSTYAITLYFDADAAGQIRLLTSELAGLTQNDYMVRNSVPPHLTLGMFHAEDADEGKVKDLFTEFARGVAKDVMADGALNVEFSGVESFLDKVLFIKPEKNERLSRLNSTLHELFLAHFEPADNRNYLPENWYPHIALAVKLEHGQFEKGMDFLKTTQGISSCRCVQIGLARCDPYTQLVDVAL